MAIWQFPIIIKAKNLMRVVSLATKNEKFLGLNKIYQEDDRVIYGEYSENCISIFKTEQNIETMLIRISMKSIDAILVSELEKFSHENHYTLYNDNTMEPIATNAIMDAIIKWKNRFA